MFGAQMPVMLDLSQQETKAGIGFLYGKENYPHLKDFQTVQDSLFWMRSFYAESDEDLDCYLIGGSFISKQRILERYKPKVESQNLPAQNDGRV